MAKYHCSHCGSQHDEIPAFHTDRPADFWDVPEDRRECDVFLTSDSCVIADRFFFVRGLIEIPILDHEDFFTWGAWVSLSEENFFRWQDSYEVAHRSHIGPFFGWLSTELPLYPNTRHLKTNAYLRDDFIRPRIELEPTDHPLSVEQHQGISLKRALEMVHLLLDQ